MKIKGEKVEVIKEIKYKCKGVKCDICGKLIASPEKDELATHYNDKYRYYSVITGHHDWGYDSVDSIEHLDVCKDCVMDFVEECIKGGISKTSGYIEIETEYVNSYEYLGGKHGLD